MMKMWYIFLIAVLTFGCSHRHVFSTLSTELALQLQETRDVKGTPIAIGLLKIDDTNQSALLKITKTDSQQSQVGWVVLHEYVSFASLVGSKGVFLKSLDPNSVTLLIRKPGN